MGAEKLVAKPIKSTIKKVTRSISREAEENIGKTFDSIHSRYWFEKNANRVNPRNIQAPGTSKFKSIVGDDPTKFVEEAVEEGNARRAAVAEHEARVASMKPPGEPLKQSTSTAALNPTPENPNYNAIGNVAVDAEQAAQAEAATQAKIYGEQLNRTISGASEDYTQEFAEEITGGKTMAKNILPNGSYGLKPGQSLKSNLKVKQAPKNYDQEVINIGVKPASPETGTEASDMIGSVGRAALGTAVAGGALMAALSSSRGQQNNAQLYGQQPLY